MERLGCCWGRSARHSRLALPASPAPRNLQITSAQTEGFKGLRRRLPPLMRPGRPGAAPLSWPAQISSCLSPSLIEFSPLQLILMDFLVPPQGPVLPN